MHAFTHSYIHICLSSFILRFSYFSIIHIFLYFFHAYIYSFIYSYIPIIRVQVLIPVLCHLLLISIVLSIYAFLSCVPSMFHLFIKVCLSCIIYFYSYRIIKIFLTPLCVHDILSFMFMFMFQFVFMFHIIFMVLEHIYTYFISYIFLVTYGISYTCTV